MWWSTPAALLILAVFSSKAEDKKVLISKVEIPKQVGVVYLIDLVNEPKYQPEAIDGGISNNIPVENPKPRPPGFLLIHAIPEQEALEDGVYFRPVDGKPVEAPQVKTTLLFSH